MSDFDFFGARIAECFSDEELSKLVALWDNDAYNELYDVVNGINEERNPQGYHSVDTLLEEEY